MRSGNSSSLTNVLLIHRRSSVRLNTPELKMRRPKRRKRSMKALARMGTSQPPTVHQFSIQPPIFLHSSLKELFFLHCRSRTRWCTRQGCMVLVEKLLLPICAVDMTLLIALNPWLGNYPFPYQFPGYPPLAAMHQQWPPMSSHPAMQYPPPPYPPPAHVLAKVQQATAVVAPPPAPQESRPGLLDAVPRASIVRGNMHHVWR
jgi:hypothetical protein